jgi:hypothetical protein
MGADRTSSSSIIISIMTGPPLPGPGRRRRPRGRLPGVGLMPPACLPVWVGRSVGWSVGKVLSCYLSMKDKNGHRSKDGIAKLVQISITRRRRTHFWDFDIGGFRKGGKDSPPLRLESIDGR